MKVRILILLTCLLLLAAVTVTAQKKATTTKREADQAVEGHRAYQNKCMSCHRETHKYPEGKQATIVMHMRVRGDLTEKEARAVLRYLTQ